MALLKTDPETKSHDLLTLVPHGLCWSHLPHMTWDNDVDIKSHPKKLVPSSDFVLDLSLCL